MEIYIREKDKEILKPTNNLDYISFDRKFFLNLKYEPVNAAVDRVLLSFGGAH